MLTTVENEFNSGKTPRRIHINDKLPPRFVAPAMQHQTVDLELLKSQSPMPHGSFNEVETHEPGKWPITLAMTINYTGVTPR
jgi:hypothetical protein